MSSFRRSPASVPAPLLLDLREVLGLAVPSSGGRYLVLWLPRRAHIQGSQTLVSLNLRLEDLLGPVTRVKKKKKKKRMQSHRAGLSFWHIRVQVLKFPRQSVGGGKFVQKRVRTRYPLCQTSCLEGGIDFWRPILRLWHGRT